MSAKREQEHSVLQGDVGDRGARASAAGSLVGFPAIPLTGAAAAPAHMTRAVMDQAKQAIRAAEAESSAAEAAAFEAKLSELGKAIRESTAATYLAARLESMRQYAEAPDKEAHLRATMGLFSVCAVPLAEWESGQLASPS